MEGVFARGDSEGVFARGDSKGVFARSERLADHWYVVATADEVAPGPIAVTVLGRTLVVWRGADGTLEAAPDRCPHREAPLSDGTVVDGCLVCPYHGWTYGREGRCERVPSAPEGTAIPPRAHLDTVAVDERYGLVWLCPGVPVVSIPAIEHDLDPAFRRINTAVEVWNTSASRMTDNFLDVSHFPYVHVDTFGRGQETVVPRLELEALDDDFFGYRYDVQADNTTGGSAASGQTDEVVRRRMTTGFNLPFTVRSTIEYETGLQHVILLCSTPIDDVTSLFTFVVWRNDDFAVPAEEIIAFDRAIGAEDRRMLERLHGMLPLDQTSLVNVQADRCSVEWRRRLSLLVDD